ncbi:MAG: methyltransferase domain-containing protein [Terriglobales bacterium]|jgi:ubiquinone/menaquinone biosynthesis C-methylase UbiE
MRRVVIPELLDHDAGSPEEIRASLADLRHINRWFGGIAVSVALVRRILPALTQRRLSLLDVGAATGDVALGVLRALSQKGIALDVTLLDRCPGHLGFGNSDLGFQNQSPAGRLRISQIPNPNPPMLFRRVAADALALPFADSSFDAVACGLFVHHLEPEQLEIFVAEALRVCRIAVLINDLRRSALPLALTRVAKPLFRSRLTRHDSAASVRRAYTMDEIRAMLPLSMRVEIRPYYLFRMGVIVWKTVKASAAE